MKGLNWWSDRCQKSKGSRAVDDFMEQAVIRTEIVLKVPLMLQLSNLPWTMLELFTVLLHYFSLERQIDQDLPVALSLAAVLSGVKTGAFSPRCNKPLRNSFSKRSWKIGNCSCNAEEFAATPTPATAITPISAPYEMLDEDEVLVSVVLVVAVGSGCDKVWVCAGVDIMPVLLALYMSVALGVE